MTEAQHDLITVGRITGLYGVQGWVKIFSYTQPRDNILNYNPWLLCIRGQWRAVKLHQGKAHGKGIIARIEGYDDRDTAATLTGVDIAIERSQLPPAGEGEYYWIDLIGLEVINQEGRSLGKVADLLETGANDVLVVKGDQERLIPYVKDVIVQTVDLKQKIMRVDWQEDE
ncbi:MAG: ribosome maturation factor RimM [Gammaproteobacteria bacterium RBG_16_57_12]|nr:MAG: ribosome maturation factor RimM [Gammaproteobacteria bacterium RBG_16_57_12]